MNDLLEAQLIETEKLWEKSFQIFEDRLKFKENTLKSKRHLDFGCGLYHFVVYLA
ncbi:MAG: hypothetical protein QW231_00575 [Candidatus Bathyarchaeia archaeon]